MNSAILEHLLKFKPFARLQLVTVSKHEYEIKRPTELRVLGKMETAVWSVDGNTDFIDLKLIERIRVDDDFGFAELERMFE